ncbi:SMI1/KNR4 family protein [Streptomyces sp. JNUCC 64]
MGEPKRTIDEADHAWLSEAERTAAEARQVTDAWRRVEAWLDRHAPGTLTALRPGAGWPEVNAVRDRIGVRVPTGLRALWSEHAGTRDLPWSAFMLGGWALMDLDTVVSVYADQRRRAAVDPGTGESPHWRAAWIPFCHGGPAAPDSGLYLDAETGRVCFWGRYGDREPRYESLTTYLEEMADRLESPALFDGEPPGLLSLPALTWGKPSPEGPGRWEPLTGV